MPSSDAPIRSVVCPACEQSSPWMVRVCEVHEAMQAGIDLREVEPDPTPALISGVAAITSAVRSAEAYDAAVDSRRRAS